MPVLWLVLIVIALGVVGYVLGRQRALGSSGGDTRDLHSLPSYYGANVFLMAVVPAMLLLMAWQLIQPLVIEGQVSGMIPETAISEGSSRGLMMSDVRRVADGLDAAVAQGAMTQEQASSIRSEFTDIRERLGAVGVALGSDVKREVLTAAQRYRALNGTYNWIKTNNFQQLT